MVKIMTLKQFIEYRNKLVIRQRSRIKHFGNPDNNYYSLRIKQIDELYPEFSSLGVIKLK